MIRFNFDRWSCARSLFAGLLAASLLLMVPAFASAQPNLQINPYWGPSSPAPGGKALFHVEVKNFGDTPTSGTPVTITTELPDGVTRNQDPGQLAANNERHEWPCSGVSIVTCVGPEEPIQTISFQKGTAGGFYPLFFPVDIDDDVAPAASATVTVSGGGLPSPQVVTSSVTFSGDPPVFGMVPESFRADIFNGLEPEAEPVRQAGTHPYELRVNFDMSKKMTERQNLPPRPNTLVIAGAGTLKTLETILPKGLVGNPEATPKCTAEDFTSTRPGTDGIPNCPLETQVGTVDPIGSLSNGEFPFDFPFPQNIPVFNLKPPTGQAADFGFSLVGNRSHIYAAVDAANGYAIRALTPFIPATVLNLGYRYIRFTMWGVPSDPSHFGFRPSKTAPPAPAGGHRPFLTSGFDCERTDTFKQRVESYEEPGVFTPYEDSFGPAVQPTGCDDPRVRFEPDVKLQPTSRAASGPTGLKVDLIVPQRDQHVENYEDLYDESGSQHAIDTPPMKKAVVTFPEGMTLSTSAAQGLGNCAPDQIKLGTSDPVTCPLDSQYGTLTLHTPILPADEPMVGKLYVAKQNDNPFHSFLALYMVIQDVERGLLIKLPAKVELDPVTGQIKTTFDQLPQFPVTDMELAFKGGLRAALVNPTTCGTKTIRAEFFSYAAPNDPAVVNDDYDITTKADGSPCVGNLAERPFRPELSAGTVSNSAGLYSPFAFRLTRTDDDQEFSQLGTILPPGLLANISGITECSEAGIAQAEAPGRSGTSEQLFPSCPASSLIGSTDVGSGVGQIITYIGGKVYLAGPYRGAPLSLVVISPIVTGPYDLGVIAVRSAIRVNPTTAQASVLTDPFPQIYQGIPVRLRDIRVNVDRPNTMVNPTSCDPMEVKAHVTGTGGILSSTVDDTAVDLSSRFQAANCGALPFKPKLSFKLKGGTKRGQFPALQATLKARPGDANIAKSTVVLPVSEFIEQGHIRTVCTRVQFAADQCPPGSIYGIARAKSPLFDETLEGPVYLRSNGGDRVLPDLVVALDGKINVTLAGFIDSVKGRVRNTFDVIPDAPVTEFKLLMRGGKKGLLINHLNLCDVTSRADVKFIGQNGKVFSSRPKMGTSCRKGRPGTR